MRKEKKTLELGELFIEKNSIDKWCNYYCLADCYDRWSTAKAYVYEKYYNMLKEHSDKLLCYGIRSYNSMIIILEAEIEKDGKCYYLMITPAHNWYCEI